MPSAHDVHAPSAAAVVPPADHVPTGHGVEQRGDVEPAPQNVPADATALAAVHAACPDLSLYVPAAQSVGVVTAVADPAGQEVPRGHSTPYMLTEPAGQKYPAAVLKQFVHTPETDAAYLPTGHILQSEGVLPEPGDA